MVKDEFMVYISYDTFWVQFLVLMGSIPTGESVLVGSILFGESHNSGD